MAAVVAPAELPQGIAALLEPKAVADSDFVVQAPVLPEGLRLVPAQLYLLALHVPLPSEQQSPQQQQQPDPEGPAQRSLSSRSAPEESCEPRAARTRSLSPERSQPQPLPQQLDLAKRPQVRASCVSNTVVDPAGRLTIAPTNGCTTTHSVFAEVLPVLEPKLTRFTDGTYLLQVPDFSAIVKTTVAPALPVLPGMKPFKPERDLPITLPGMSNVVFDPKLKTPAGAMVTSSTRMYGALLHYPREVGLDVKIRTHCLKSTMTFELPDSAGAIQAGEHQLRWSLKVDAKFSEEDGPNDDLHGLKVDFAFFFKAEMRSQSGAGW